jgi:hypothetical protein
MRFQNDGPLLPFEKPGARSSESGADDGGVLF